MCNSEEILGATSDTGIICLAIVGRVNQCQKVVMYVMYVMNSH